MSPSCPLCGLNTKVEPLRWDPLWTRGRTVAARDAYLCERCNLVFEGGRAEWEHGWLGEHPLRDRRRGIAGRMTPEERIAGLEHVERLRRALHDDHGADRCLASIDQISRGVL